MKKKFTAFMVATLATVSAMATDYSDLIFYINPGHGGHDQSNDRNVVIYPYELGAVSYSRGSSQPRDQIWVSCTAGRFFTS